MILSVSRSEIAERIGKLRRDWTETVEGESLLDAQASVGFLLFDLAEAFGLTPAQTKAALGDRLYKELDQEINGLEVELIQ